MNIALSKPLFDNEELSEIEKVLESGWVMQGPKVAEFEQEFSRVVNSDWSVAVSSCSTALHLAMKAIGIGKGDEVIVPALTWIATAAAVEECEGTVVFCDIDPATFNIDPNCLDRLINPRTKAIVAVNLFGLAADLPKLVQIAQANDLILIEDAACSLGATVNEKASGTFGRLGCFSFHPRKSITTGEGGMIVGASLDDELLLRSLRSHGVKTSPKGTATSAQPYDLGDFDKLGYNYRLTDLQAALGIAQLRKLERILQRRREIARAYDSGLSDLELLRLPTEPEGFVHTYQSYVMMVGASTHDRNGAEKMHDCRNRIMIDLKQAGVATRPGTHAVHTLEYFEKKYGLSQWSAPNANAAMNQSIALPLHPLLTTSEVEYVIHSVRKAYDAVFSVRNASATVA
ncbi:MAG: DegT/DnrJ/EryC1/StrS family aminotransferase [bacterium]|nr:DegT/DnrJ/EryC1/StrS family aminotransferase [bacterium]